MSHNWSGWHGQYDDPRSTLIHRAQLTHRALHQAIDLAPGGAQDPLYLVSICAGEGRDLLPVLAAPRTERRISATLIEIDRSIASVLSASLKSLGLSNASVRIADAGLADSYMDLPPAHILLVSGVFGNIADVDVKTTVEALPTFLVADGLVVWTRSRRSAELDASQYVQACFAERGFECVGSDVTPDGTFRVAVDRIANRAARQEGAPCNTRMFVFRTDPNNLGG